MQLSSLRRLWPVLLVAVAIALLFAWFAQRGTVAEAVVARYSTLVRTLQFSARVATLSRVDVGATVTGRVEQVLVREGDTVRSGQPLVRLEADEARAALAQSAAAERQAQALIAGLRSTGRSAAQAQLAQAEATLTAAQAELARTEQLVAQGFLSAARLDEVRRSVAVAQGQRQAAAAQVQANEERGTEIAQAQAQLAAARAATAAAQARLAQVVVTAPSDARVLVRDVEPGQIVQPGKALLALALAGPTQIEAQVDERFLEQLRPGQKAVVVADAFPGQRLAATVLRIAPAVDAQRGAVEVKLSLDQPPPAFLREDMTLSVEVETGRRERALVLPARALHGRAGAESVLIAEDGRAVERSVRTGMRTLDAVEVLSGVAEGEEVLLGAQLKAGERVRPKVEAWQPARSTLAASGKPEDAMANLTQSVGR